MPPAKRGRPAGSTRTPSTKPQQTLAFGNSNKITKPSRPSASAADTRKKASPSLQKNEDVAKAIDEAPVKAPVVDEVKDEDEEVVDEDPAFVEGRERGMALRQAPQQQKQKGRDEVEEKAMKVPDAAVKRYWRDREAERKAPRVHQQRLSLHEKILRHFDLSSQYGPCIGISRIRRWKRAQGLGLAPPIEVLAVLVKEEAEGKKGMEKAFMDGLL
ncbi:MAG: hypothetical protein Q9183_006837, partial [Haloplaca sp. 2 TL-2023]